MFHKIGQMLSGILFFLLSSLSFILKLVFFFPAVFILRFPLWLTLIAIAFISFVPIFGSLLNIALWIWAFIVCLDMPFTTMSLIFYILFALNALDLIQAIIRTALESK